MVPAPKKAWSTYSAGKKFLIVIACIAGGFFVLSMIAFGYAYWWLIRRGDQIPVAAVMFDQSRGYLALHAENSDPGVKKLFELVAKKINEQNGRSYPKGFPEPLKAYFGNQQDPKTLAEFWPRQAALSLERPLPGAEGGELIAAVNFDSYGGLVRGGVGMLAWISRQEQKNKVDQGESGEQVIVHRAHEIWSPGNVAITAIESTLVVGSTVETVKRVIDRVLDQPGGLEVMPERFQTLSERFAKNSDAHIILDDVAGFTDVAPEGVPPAVVADAAQAIDRFAASFDLVDEDLLVAKAVFFCKSADAARASEPFVDALMTDLIARAAESKLKLTYSKQVVGKEVVIDQKLTGIGELIANSFSAALEAKE